MKKKRQNFTIDRDLLEWLRSYASNESRTMSSLINSLVLELKRKHEGSQKGSPPNQRNVLKANN
jgi:post-segregation antitoxin (ccd killing protein)